MDKIYFKRLAVILESILKLIDSHQNKMKLEFDNVNNSNFNINKAIIETFKVINRRIKGEVMDETAGIKISELLKEETAQREFFRSETKLVSQEIKDIQQDIIDFIKKIDTDKID